MAGTRQHYIPKLLLRGFASRRRRDAVYVWQFRGDRPPVEPNIINVAVANRFYGDPETERLDAQLTDCESVWARMLADLRKTETIECADKQVVADFVANMLFRTHHLRSALMDAMQRMMRVASEHHTVPERIRQVVEDNFDQQAAAIVAELRATTPSFDERRALAIIAASRAELISHSARLTTPLVLHAIDGLTTRMGQMGMTAHNTALLKASAAEASSPLRQGLGALTWHLSSYEKGALILGDVVVLRRDPETGLICPASADALGGGPLLLPVSDRHLLMGTATADPELPELDQLNRATAELSREFFVASEKTEREMGYAKLIGTRSGLLPDDELDRMINESLNNS